VAVDVRVEVQAEAKDISRCYDLLLEFSFEAREEEIIFPVLE